MRKEEYIQKKEEREDIAVNPQPRPEQQDLRKPIDPHFKVLGIRI